MSRYSPDLHAVVNMYMHSFSITAVAMVVFAESAYTASEADNSVTVGVALGPGTVLDPNLSVGVRIRAIRFGQLAIYTYLLPVARWLLCLL